MLDLITPILATPPDRDLGEIIGRSREGRLVRAIRIGSGPIRLSLLGGCHADEPVGPRFLAHLTPYLATLPPKHPLLDRYQWWIVPHINPDGEARNRDWYSDEDLQFDVTRYLSGAVRELPSDDIEFGFPRRADDRDARPENRAVFDWWRSADGPFDLHVTLHGMGFAAGPWFLIEPAWADRSSALRALCRTRVAELGYGLHDVERHGEKGFTRLERGFATRPDSEAMRRYFLERNDPETADRFRPNSMETIRSLGADPLTLVSEMPLFITPGVGDSLGPPDPVALEWKARVEGWRNYLDGGGSTERVEREASQAGLRAMPIKDQMELQWTLVVAGLREL